MDDLADELLRWGMAGWTFILEIAAFLSIYKLILNYNDKFAVFGNRIHLYFPTEPLSSLATLGAMGIPLGFLIYQIYFYLFWTIPLSKAEPPEKKIVKKILKCSKYNPSDSDLNDVYKKWVESVINNKGTKNKKRWVKLVQFIRKREIKDLINFRNYWSLAQAIWLHNVDDKHDRAAKKLQYLSYMFDSLGAIITAICLALFTLFIYNGWLIGRYGLYKTFPLKLNLLFASIKYIYLWQVVLLISAIEILATYIFYKILWVNRIHIRSSIVTLMHSFICNFNCIEECGKKRRNHFVGIKQGPEELIKNS